MMLAGITMAEVSQSETAVYEASMVDDYNKFTSKDAETMPQMTATGTAHSIMANRISWFFNLLGPSLHVDTACSSSMVAVDLACQFLQNKLGSMASVLCYD
jgi:acyl transferase domain-containing protein